MKRLIMILATLLPVFSIYATVNLTVTKAMLPNNVSLYYLPNHSLPIVDVELILHAGSMYDGQHFGIASATAAMLEEGAGNMNAAAVANSFLRSGAQYTAKVGRLDASLHLRSLVDSKYLNPALVTFNQLIVKPSFPLDAFVRVQQQLQDAILLAQQDPQSVAKRKFYNTVYGGTPYAHDPLGTKSSVAQLSDANIRAFYHKYYNLSNCKIIITGDVSLQQAKQMAAKILHGLPTAKDYSHINKAMQHAAGIYRVNFPSQQTTVWMGQVGVSRLSKDYLPLKLGNEILGGNQQNARLFETMRNKYAYVYSVYSVFSAKPFNGPFVIIFQTKNSSAKAAIATASKMLRHFVKHGVSQHELAIAKNKLINGFYLNLYSNTNLLAAVALVATQNLPLDYLATFQSRVALINRADVRHAFASIVRPKHLALIIVGPNKKSEV